MTVYRDADRDDQVDPDGETQSGVFGINIHRANPERPSGQVDRWSAGCQVIQDPDHFDFIMVLAKRAMERWGNSLTYTLLTAEELKGAL